MAPTISALADAVGVPRNPYVRWSLAVGFPAACYLLASSRRRAAADGERTDFDGFLQQVEPVGSTGSTQAAPGLTSGPIDQFFKDAGAEVDHRNPLDFDSFLVSARGGRATSSAKPATPAPKAAAPQLRPKPEHVQVLVMYGTEYGFSKEIAEKLCDQLRATGKYWPVLRNMADCPDGYNLANEQAVFVACSTQGDGVPPTEARDFCEWLFAGKAGPLGHLNYSVCALGDRSYTHFCRCGKQLDEALVQAGASCLVERVDVNKEDWPVVDAWLKACLDALAKQTLKPISSTGGVVGEEPAAVTHKKWGKSRPYSAGVVALEPLCALTSADDKNTFRAEFDLGESGIAYVPGDALGIYPTNAPQFVSELIAAMGASAAELVPVPSWHYEEPSAAYNDGKMPLEQALAKCYDLRSPKAELLKLLLAALQNAPAANGHSHVNGNGHAASEAGLEHKLKQMIAEAAAAEAYLSSRHVIDVLTDFPGARLSTSQVLSALRQLQPRLYSISSSPLEGASRVQATIAEVKYTAHGKDRIGVCSTYVSERLQVGSHVPVYVHRNPDFRLPASRETPIIMVGPGTGLAPFRSFILERLLQAEQDGGKPGQMVLYFGCRRSDQDYLYGPVLEEWASQGKIKLLTAFSRQTAKKVYVQHRLAESADMLWELLQQGAHFYVCGDASSMAGAVEEALLAVIEARLGTGRAGAKEYLKAMSSSGRYERDVWY